MHAPSLLARARIPVGIIVLSMLVLSLAFPALANPAALGVGVTVAVAFAFREGMPFDARSRVSCWSPWRSSPSPCCG